MDWYGLLFVSIGRRCGGHLGVLRNRFCGGCSRYPSGAAKLGGAPVEERGDAFLEVGGGE
ncbi:hypothetical protein Pd630_LPD04443 [Rhodococcus opacus PD630]|nr:hypothetical protein Pd630_LPD04443 [Rhodococcus opacus PD630]